MITRNHVEPSVEAAKVTLKKKGWSYRPAAKHLGYSYTHFAWVLTGRRQSKTLLREIASLPVNKKKSKKPSNT